MCTPSRRQGFCEGFGAPCGRSVLLRRRSGRATTPSERASWQGRSAKKQDISENAANFRIFLGKMQMFMKIYTFLMKFHDFWHRICEEFLARICYVFCIEILARISDFLAFGRKT